MPDENVPNQNEMQKYFEKILDEQGFDPEANEYWVVHHEVAIDGDPHMHTHLIAVPKGNDNDKS